MQQDKEDNKEIAEIEDAIPANVNLSASDFTRNVDCCDLVR